MRSTRSLMLSLCLVAVAMPALAADPPAFTQLNNFPATPGTDAYSIVAGELGDGRFILWDGDAIWFQDAVGADAFTQQVAGVVGDPSFLSVAPDGHTVLLGGGWRASGDIYSYDANTPATAPTTLTTEDHYWGTHISATQLLIDRAAAATSELGILDLSSTTYRTVITGKTSWSAAVGVDPSMEYAYATEGETGETRRFAVSDLIAAYNDSTPLSWTSGQLLGNLNSGGVGAVTADGVLLLGNYFPGSVQAADAETGDEIWIVNDLAGDGSSYGVAFSGGANEILIIGNLNGDPNTMTAWVAEPPEVTPTLPAASTAALVMLSCALAFVGIRRRIR